MSNTNVYLYCYLIKHIKIYTMKKYRNLVIDRYFLKFQELPNEIKEVSKNMYLCSSANHKAKIEVKDTTPHIEAILYYVFY